MSEPAEKTPWYKNTSLLGSAAAFLGGVGSMIAGVDLGSENVSNVVFGSAAVTGGVLLAWKGIKGIAAVLKAAREKGLIK